MAFRLDQDDFFDVMEERGTVLGNVLGNVPVNVPVNVPGNVLGNVPGNVLRVLCQRLRRQNEASAAAPAALSGLAGPAQAITS